MRSLSVWIQAVGQGPRRAARVMSLARTLSSSLEPGWRAATRRHPTAREQALEADERARARLVARSQLKRVLGGQ